MSPSRFYQGITDGLLRTDQADIVNKKTTLIVIHGSFHFLDNPLGVGMIILDNRYRKLTDIKELEWKWKFVKNG